MSHVQKPFVHLKKKQKKIIRSYAMFVVAKITSILFHFKDSRIVRMQVFLLQTSLS